MDIVSLEHIRTLLVKCTPLKQSQFKHAKINVPEDLRAYFKRPESYADFAATVKSVFVEYDEESGNLLLSVSCFLGCCINVMSHSWWTVFREKPYAINIILCYTVT